MAFMAMEFLGRHNGLHENHCKGKAWDCQSLILGLGIFPPQYRGKGHNYIYIVLLIGRSGDLEHKVRGW